MTISTQRWIAKKVSRSAVALGSWAAHSVGARRGGIGPSVRVLTYHRFGERVRDPWSVGAEEFEAQVRWLAERGLAVSLDDVAAFARSEKSLPDGAALITTDDGHESVATIAAPILARYSVPSVAFITTGLVGAQGVIPGDPYMTWEQVARLGDSFVTLGSHAHEHRSLGKIPLEHAMEEGRESRELLRRYTGIDVKSFAYPYGMRKDESAETRRVLAEVGYETIFTAQHGIVSPGADLLRLPRVKVEGGDPAWLFPRLCRGSMDVWKLFDDSMWIMQRPER